MAPDNGILEPTVIEEENPVDNSVASPDVSVPAALAFHPVPVTGEQPDSGGVSQVAPGTPAASSSSENVNNVSVSGDVTMHTPPQASVIETFVLLMFLTVVFSVLAIE